MLQGAEGLRARGAVIRIIEVPMEAGKGFQADIYAEGEVRITGQETAPRAEARTVAPDPKTGAAQPLQAFRPDAAQGAAARAHDRGAVGFRRARTARRRRRRPPARRPRPPGTRGIPPRQRLCLLRPFWSPSPCQPRPGAIPSSSAPDWKTSRSPRPGPRRREEPRALPRRPTPPPPPRRPRAETSPRWTCRRSRVPVRSRCRT